MPRTKTFTGQLVEVTASKATGPGNYRTVAGASIQGILDFLTENRIPMNSILGGITWDAGSSQYLVMYHL